MAVEMERNGSKQDDKNWVVMGYNLKGEKLAVLCDYEVWEKPQWNQESVKDACPFASEEAIAVSDTLNDIKEDSDCSIYWASTPVERELAGYILSLLDELDKGEAQKLAHWEKIEERLKSENQELKERIQSLERELDKAKSSNKRLERELLELKSKKKRWFSWLSR